MHPWWFYNYIHLQGLNRVLTCLSHAGFYTVYLYHIAVKHFLQPVVMYATLWSRNLLCLIWTLMHILIFLILPVPISWILLPLWSIKSFSLYLCPGTLKLYVLWDGLANRLNANGRRTVCRFIMKSWEALITCFRTLQKLQNANICLNLSQIIVINLKLYFLLKWGKYVFDTLPIFQGFPLTKNGEICNFHRRHTSTVRQNLNLKNPENHSVWFINNELPFYCIK